MPDSTSRGDHPDQTPPAATSGGATAPGYGPSAQALAEMWQRIVARFLDSLLVAITTAIITFVVTFGSSGYLANAVTAVVSTVLYLGYFTFMESRDGQTLGKQLLGIRVVDAEGDVPSLDKAFMRNAWMGVGILGIIPFIGSLIGGLLSLGLVVLILVTISQDSEHRRGWHDKLAGGTRVLKTRP